MSNYNNLKTSIDANIKQNSNQEITGSILNSVLNQMVNILGTGYQFAGVAVSDTDPGTPDAKVFYIANGKGTYEKFGGIGVTEDDVVVLYWDTAWHKVSTGIASHAKLSELEEQTGKNTNTIIGLKDQVENYKPIVIEGDVTNAADEEDITSANGLLQLKNRSSLNGMGYVILRKDKTFAEQVTQANTIYEIRYDFHIDGTEDNPLEIPEKSILKFNGGKLYGGVMKGSNTVINAATCQIFGSDISFDGTFLNKTLYVDWFGAKANDKSAASTNVTAINAACRCAALRTTFDSINSVTLSKGTYYIDGSIELPMTFMYFGGEEQNDTATTTAYPTIHQLANAPIIKLVSRNNFGGTYLYNFKKTTIKNLSFESSRKDDYSNTYCIYGSELAGISSRIENVIMTEGSFVRCGIYLGMEDAYVGLMETCFRNVSLMKCDIGIFIDGKTNTWMNGNSFEKIVCTGCKLWGIIIGPMLGQSMNNTIRDSFFEECGMDYNYSDYSEMGAGGIKLLHTSMTIDNCYFEANFAARHMTTGSVKEGESVFNGAIGESGNEEHIEPTELSKYEAGIFCQGGHIIVTKCSFATSHRTISVYQNKCILDIRDSRPTTKTLNEKTSQSLVNYIPNSNGGLDALHLRFRLFGGYTQWNLKSVYEILGNLSSGIQKISHIDILVVDELGIKQCEEYVNCGKYRENTVFYISNETGKDTNIGTNERNAFKSFDAFNNSDLHFPETIVVKLMDNITVTKSLAFNASIKNILFQSEDEIVSITNTATLFNFNKNLRIKNIAFRGLNIIASRMFCIMEDYVSVEASFSDCNITLNSNFIYGTKGNINVAFDNCVFDADTTSRWIARPNNRGIISTSLNNCSNPKNLKIWNTYSVNDITGGRNELPIYDESNKIMGFWDNEDADPTKTLYNLDYSNAQRVRIVKGARISSISLSEVKAIFAKKAKAYIVVEDITIPLGETLSIPSNSILIVKGGIIKGDGTLSLDKNLIITLSGTLDDIKCNITGSYAKGQRIITNNGIKTWDGFSWLDEKGNPFGISYSGETRPLNAPIGFCFLDTSLSKPIYWTGTKWVDATGADV